MLRVLHIVPNEKYIRCMISLWDNLPANCRYVCVDALGESFYKSFEDRVEFMGTEALIDILHSNSYDAVVFSSLPVTRYSLVLEIPADRIVIWQSVGYDIYSENYPYKSIVSLDLYKPLTKSFILSRTQKTAWQKIRHILKCVFVPISWYHKLQHRKQRERNAALTQEKALKRIDYISTVLESEYSRIQNNPWIRAKYFHFQFVGPIPNMDDVPIIDFEKSKYLLLGNSGDETNNHLDVLDVIRQRNISNSIYASISYGGEMDYVARVVSELGQNKDNIIQTDFMPIETYRNLLLQCRVAVFGHIRQQALGNIGLAMKQGSKVFLYKDSITYKYYKSQGLFVFSIEDDLTQENIDTPLTHAQIQHNRSFFAHTYENVLQSMMVDIQDMEKQYLERKH